MTEKRLIDKKELGEKHPYLNNQWRLNYLIRTAQIPVVRVGKRIAFEESAIDRWIDERTRTEVAE